MNYTVKYPIAQISVFLWLGFVCAISFMEAWVKFQAPGITVPLGLGIGKLVFGALNIMEWLFAICIGINLFFAKNHLFKKEALFYLVPLVLLFLQTIWLLPFLDDRAAEVIAGHQVPHSFLHYYYVAFEIIKVICLFIFGFKLYKKQL